MTYPTSATTYTLPFGDKIRVSSNRRYVLVRQIDGPDKPFIVKRSDKFDTVHLEFNLLAGRTDYLIDQAEGTIVVWFNGHFEVSDVAGKFIRQAPKVTAQILVKDASSYTARTLHGEVTF
jgi:hypothetical protein